MEQKRRLQKPADKATAHDQRTELVRQMMAQESAASDAKTAKLRALRLAREATQAEEPAPAKPAPKRKA